MSVNRTASAMLMVLLLGIVTVTSQNKIHAQQRLDHAMPMGGISTKAEVKNQISIIRQAGLQRDRAYIVEIINELKNPRQRQYAFAAMHTLAQLGAIEAVPVVDTYINMSDQQTSLDPDLSNFAVAVKARIFAEHNASGISDDKTKASVKVEAFYENLGLTSNDLNTAVSSYHIPYSEMKTDASGRPVLSSTSSPTIRPVALHAMRELADMVYQGNYKDYISLPEVANVNFKDDYASALKMRLAPLPRSQRLSTLVQELSHRKVGTDERNYDLQLAINEGLAASKAAAAELQVMDTHREYYDQTKHHSGFVSMFYIIAGVGDQTQKPLIEHFTQDSDPWVRHYAQVAYRSLCSQVNRETEVAY